MLLYYNNKCERRIVVNIKELRLKKGLTQFQVAVMVGVSITTYIGWERGGWNPSPKNMKKLKDILGVK